MQKGKQIIIIKRQGNKPRTLLPLFHQTNPKPNLSSSSQLSKPKGSRDRNRGEKWPPQSWETHRICELLQTTSLVILLLPQNPIDFHLFHSCKDGQIAIGATVVWNFPILAETMMLNGRLAWIDFLFMVLTMGTRRRLRQRHGRKRNWKLKNPLVRYFSHIRISRASVYLHLVLLLLRCKHFIGCWKSLFICFMWI